MLAPDEKVEHECDGGDDGGVQKSSLHGSTLPQLAFQRFVQPSAEVPAENTVVFVLCLQKALETVNSLQHLKDTLLLIRLRIKSENISKMVYWLKIFLNKLNNLQN